MFPVLFLSNCFQVFAAAERIWQIHQSMLFCATKCTVHVLLKQAVTPTHFCFEEILDWNFFFDFFFLFLLEDKSRGQCMPVDTLVSIRTTPEPAIQAFVKCFQEIFTHLQQSERMWYSKFHIVWTVECQGGRKKYPGFNRNWTHDLHDTSDDV